MKWRTVFTDSESETGVAPVCENRDPDLHESDGGPLEHRVFDCCPHPHIETWSEPGARELAALLSRLEAEMCS